MIEEPRSAKFSCAGCGWVGDLAATALDERTNARRCPQCGRSVAKPIVAPSTCPQCGEGTIQSTFLPNHGLAAICSKNCGYRPSAVEEHVVLRGRCSVKTCGMPLSLRDAAVWKDESLHCPECGKLIRAGRGGKEETMIGPDSARREENAVSVVERNDAERVFNWRFDILVLASYSVENARKLAERSDVDLHVATALRENGCPEEKAIEILL